MSDEPTFTACPQCVKWKAYSDRLKAENNKQRADHIEYATSTSWKIQELEAEVAMWKEKWEQSGKDNRLKEAELKKKDEQTERLLHCCPNRDGEGNVACEIYYEQRYSEDAPKPKEAGK